mmetsp:Transcript_6100/g.10986  ORF Transcript_6100/g.10986 Transcript_6100/m.10986 type:complete len:87 (+) Transcript_6100:92-352(+)
MRVMPPGTVGLGAGDEAELGAGAGNIACQMARSPAAAAAASTASPWKVGKLAGEGAATGAGAAFGLKIWKRSACHVEGIGCFQLSK